MLAIAGGKGGAGKTTTAAGLAAAMAERGATPLLVDTDVDMPDLHHVAGTPRTPGLAAVRGGRAPESVARRAARLSGAALLPVGDADALTVSTLARVADWDGPVLLDCPAGASETAAAPLRAADRTVLVSTATAASLTDAAKTAATARALDAPPVGAVLSRTRTAPGTAALLGCDVLATVPRVDPPVLEAAELRAACRRVAANLNGRNT